MLSSIFRKNPSQVYLGEREPVAVLAATAARLRELLAVGDGAWVEAAPAVGKWSPREIVCHLADCEIAHSFRLRQGLAEENPTVQPFDQEKWAAHYAGYDAELALATFDQLRRWNLKLIAQMPEGARERPMLHPERGAMTVQTLLETMAGHDRNHLIQMEAIVAGLVRPGRPGTGDAGGGQAGSGQAGSGQAGGD